MSTLSLRLRAILLAAGVALLASSGWAVADPPSRVARLGYLSGAVSFSPAGENYWMLAGVNRPLTTGDRLWSDADGRAELQVGGADVRMGAGAGLTILNIDDEIAQLQLTQGTLNVRVRRLGPNQVFEVDTPNLALTLRQPGAYRIEVDPDGQSTTVVMRRGQEEVYGQGAAYVIDSGRSYHFTGTDLREYYRGDMPRLDDFDRWSDERDRPYDNSISSRYVSPDVIGYQDLDANGTWRSDPTYGNVWYPSRVGADWAPYRDGHWAWVEPWGWTWVDDAPWGFAVSHYGRWANLGGTWGWVPGPVRSRAYCRQQRDARGLRPGARRPSSSSSGGSRARAPARGACFGPGSPAAPTTMGSRCCRTECWGSSSTACCSAATAPSSRRRRRF